MLVPTHGNLEGTMINFSPKKRNIDHDVQIDSYNILSAISL